MLRIFLFDIKSWKLSYSHCWYRYLKIPTLWNANSGLPFIPTADSKSFVTYVSVLMTPQLQSTPHWCLCTGHKNMFSIKSSRQRMPTGPWKVVKVGSNINRDSEDHCYRQLVRWMGGFAFASQFSMMCAVSAIPPFDGFPPLLNAASFICIPWKQHVPECGIVWPVSFSFIATFCPSAL